MALRDKVTYHAKRLALEYVVGLPLWPGPARSVVLRALGVEVGRGTVIRARCVFTDPNVSFGEDCWIGIHVTFGRAGADHARRPGRHTRTTR